MKDILKLSILVLSVIFYLDSGVASSDKNIDDGDMFSFKALNMFFNEPYLKNLRVQGLKMEGSKGIQMQKYLSDLIKKGGKYISSELQLFGEQLENGIEITKNILDDSVLSDGTVLKVSAVAKTHQSFLLSTYLNYLGAKIIIPLSWSGPEPHAIAIQIERLENDNFNLVVFNTGDGVNYHYSKPGQYFDINDWRRIYPVTFQLWIEFENVPMGEIFDETAWFFSGLIFMQSKKKMENTVRVNSSVNSSVSDYFYGSFLANLEKYLKVTNDESDDRTLVPAQRSGSCTMSCLLAVLQYTSSNLKSYYRNKIMLGYILLEDFLSNHVQGKIIKLILSDGSESIGRNLFKKLASTAALHLAQYLEEALPEFKNSSLLGFGRDKWLENHKLNALEKLKQDEEALKFLAKTTEYCNIIFNVLDHAKFDESRTQIKKIYEFDKITKKSSNQSKLSNRSDTIFNSNYFQEIFENYHGRLEKSPISLEKLIQALQDAINSSDSSVNRFVHVQYAFRMLVPSIWEPELWSGVSPYLCLTLMERSGKILEQFLVGDNGKKFAMTSLENILMIAEIMTLSWYAAVHYDNVQPSRLGLIHFGSPMLSFLKLFNSKCLIPGINREGGVNVNFESITIDHLRRLVKSSQLNENNTPFLDTFDLISEANRSIELDVLCDHVNGNLKRKFVFDEISKHNENCIKRKIESKKQHKSYFSDNKKWIEAPEEKLQILLIFADPEITKTYRHFQYLIEILFLSHYCLVYQGVKFEKNVNSRIFVINDRSLSVIFNQIGGFFYEFETVFTLVSRNSSRDTKIERDFFDQRHSAIFQGKGLTLVGFEYWLNYVKSATDSTIFSNFSFCTKSDLVLNMPSLKAAFDLYGNDYNHLFFPGFKKDHAEEVIQELLRLVLENFKIVKQVKGIMDLNIRTSLIKTAVNIGIILTKFISRCSFHKVIISADASIILAKVYNEFYEIGKVVSHFSLDDEVISAANLVLTQICSITHLDENGFLEHATLSRRAQENGVQGIFVRTMARYHWFITKTNYKKTNSEDLSLADGLYDYGFTYFEIAAEETDFLTFTLKSEYIPKLEMYQNVEGESSASDYSILYSSGSRNPNIAKIMLNDNFSIILQLSTGLVYIGDFSLHNMTKIVDDTNFNAYFKETFDKVDALRGTFTKVGQFVFYYLTDFKISGSDIAILISDRNFSLYRKISEKWFKWENHSRIKWAEELRNFHSITSSNSQEMLVIADNEEIPILKYIFIDEYEYIFVGDLEKPEEEQWLVVPYCTSLGNTLDKFSSCDENKILAFSKSTEADSFGSLIVILPGMRLSSAPKYPLVLKEIGSNEIGSAVEMQVLNSPDLTVVRDQTTDGKIQIPFTLIVRNEDGKLFILVPKFEHRDKRIKIDLDDRVIQNSILTLEMIPIFEQTLAPQTRYQRLLLGYYHILAFEYDKARSLLHYIKSVTLNSPLTDEELWVIEWIICIDEGGPEADALKILIYAQYVMSKIKFPLRYVKDNLSKNCMDQIEMIEGAIKPVLVSYMNSIREIPEKFYIHYMLPEIKTDEMFGLIFKAGWRECASQVKSPRSEIIYPPSGLGKFISNISDFDFEFKVLEGGEVTKFLAAPANLTKIMTKLMHKCSGTGTLSKDNEILLYGFLNDKESWLALNHQLMDYYSKFNSHTVFNLALKEITALTIHYEEFYGRNFLGINKSSRISPDLSVILEVFRRDSSEYSVNTDESDQINFDFKVASEEQINVFMDLKASLENLTIQRNPQKWINPKSIFGALFESETIQQFTVLKKLETSIIQFIMGNQSKLSGDVDLSSLHSKINDFVIFVNGQEDLLSCKEIELNEQLKTMRYHGNNKLSKDFEELLQFLHNRKEKNFNHLHSCYQMNSVSCVQGKFPGLKREECETILLLTAKYYSVRVLLELMRHVRQYFTNFQNTFEPASVEDLEIFCSELGKIEDFNSRLQDKSILNFEYKSMRYRLRKEQVGDIELLTQSDKSEVPTNFNSIVIQRMMAAGKTLILGTVAVVKKALMKPDKLSILVPPASLYQSNTTAMQARTYAYFKKRGQTFVFPRFETPQDYNQCLVLQNYLSHVMGLFDSTMKSSDYLILSPGCLQSFHNSYIEMINHALNLKNDYYLSVEMRNILIIYARIYHVFSNNSSIIMDEIDMTMEPHKELNFPTQECENLNMKAAVLIADLIEVATFSETIVTGCKLYVHNNEQYTLTDVGFECVKDHWVTYLRNELLGVHKSIWKDLLIPETFGHSDTLKLVEFLSKPIVLGEDLEWIKKVDREVDHSIVNALIIIRAQVHERIRGSFKGAVNQSYGFGGKARPGILYAVPFIAANTPSTNSVFADRWETMTKTLLMYASVPCSEEIAIKMIKYIRESIVKNLAPGIEEKDTLIGSVCANLFEEAVHFNSFDAQNREHVELVHKVLKDRSPLAIRLLFSYALDEVLSSIEFPIQQITSNSLNMASMFASVQGYSGTIDNVNTLPHEVVEEAFRDNLINEKNNGGIARKLILDNRNALVPQLSFEIFFSNDSATFIRAILNSCDIVLGNDNYFNSVSAIIDTGAFFKAFRNKSVAEGILKVFSDRTDAVIFYDEDTNQLEFIVRENIAKGESLSYRSGFLSSSDPESILKATGTDIHRRFTFYDQRHVTGSDILQPKHACAIMTAGARVKIRDIMQGSLRMRQFMSSQKVHIVTSESALEFYRSYIPGNGEIRVSDILALGCINENEAQNSDNAKLAFMKIDNEIRRFVLETISASLLIVEGSTLEEYNITPSLEWFKNFKSKFIRDIRERPIDWLELPESRDAKDVLIDYVNLHITLLNTTAEAVCKNDSETLNQLVIDIKNLQEKINTNLLGIDAPERNVTFLKLLEGRKLSGAGNMDEGREVQFLVRVMALQEVNLEVESEQTRTKWERTDLAEIKLGNFADDETFLDDSKLISLNQVAGSTSLSTQNDEKFRFNDVFVTSGRRIWVTSDIIRINSKTERPSVLSFTDNTWEGGHFMVQVRKCASNDELRITLLSKYFAEIIHDNLIDPERPEMEWIFWLCDLSGQITASSAKGGDFVGLNIMNIIPLASHLIFDALIFNGSIGTIMISPILKDIFENIWLNNLNFKERGMFVLSRMKHLRNKAQYTLSPNSYEYSKLYRAASGDLSVFTDHFKTFGCYFKSLTENDLNLQLRINGHKKYNFPEKSKNGICLMDKLKEILGDQVTIRKSSASQIEPEYCPIARNLKRNDLCQSHLEQEVPKAKLEIKSYDFNINENDILDVIQVKINA